jgi:hypothetical protein
MGTESNHDDEVFMSFKDSSRELEVSMPPWVRGPKSLEDISKNDYCPECQKSFEIGDYTVFCMVALANETMQAQEREFHVNCENPKKATLRIKIEIENDEDEAIE